MAKEHLSEVLPTPAKKIHPAWWFAIGGIVVLVLLSSVAVVYGRGYENRVLPGVHIGSIAIGGMEEDELRAFLGSMRDKLLSSGIRVELVVPAVSVNKTASEPNPTDLSAKLTKIVIPLGSDTTSTTLGADIDVEREVNRLLTYGKRTDILVGSWVVLTHAFNKHDIGIASLRVDSEGLDQMLQARIAEYSREPQNARLDISSTDPLVYQIVTSSPGIGFALEDATKQVVGAWSKLTPAELRLTGTILEPTVKRDELEPIAARVPEVFAPGPHVITFTNPDNKRQHTWTITKAELVAWLHPQRNDIGEIVFGLDTSSTKAFLAAEVLPEIEVKPRDAVFELNEAGTKAVKFVSSRTGVTVDMEASIAAINAAMHTRTTSDEPQTKSELVTKTVEPEITTAESNDLGIAEELGTGFSNFSGSPRNRILNIKHAVLDKLHGTIIKPGEEFSLVKTLRPFTLEDGYLPELVIVGNRIKPEVAGGLCQVGTTMFRAAMKSAMPITQRVNHGLVVSYYNDPSNGNPGTDATIYDGWPDFRFMNDTGHHLMITVAMNESTKDLYFTLWGTSDGRQGSYTAPQVSQWFPTGPYKEIQTTDLPPGKRECQSAHPGAVASFTYNRTLPSGETVSRIFESTYRAVPETCYVGVEKITQCQDDGSGEGCAIGSSEKQDATDCEIDPFTGKCMEFGQDLTAEELGIVFE